MGPKLEKDTSLSGIPITLGFPLLLILIIIVSLIVGSISLLLIGRIKSRDDGAHYADSEKWKRILRNVLLSSLTLSLLLAVFGFIYSRQHTPKSVQRAIEHHYQVEVESILITTHSTSGEEMTVLFTAANEDHFGKIYVQNGYGVLTTVDSKGNIIEYQNNGGEQ